MLNIINRYAHGFVAIPVILALQERGLFELLERRGALDETELQQALSANSGNLQVALRLLISLGWLARDERGRYSLNAKAAVRSRIPPLLLQAYRFPIGSPRLLEQAATGYVEAITLARQRWGLDDCLEADLMDGALLIPLLFALRSQGLLNPDVPPSFTQLSSALATAVAALFRDKGWIAGDVELPEWTEIGRHLLERMMVLGVTASYTPLLANLPVLLFGDPQQVFGRQHGETENHLERSLNVVASGFQHEKFFQDFDAAVQTIFDRQPLEQQPTYVADMGSGDGTLLLRIYQHIRTHTARGQALDSHPLTLIAIDYNPEALAVASAKLQAAGAPFLAVTGDVGDPQRLERDLAEQGIDDCGSILHVRSFLDHDRPWHQPAPSPELAARQNVDYPGVFVAENGSAIASADAIQALYEHLLRWAGLSSRHGLLLLEVHCLDAADAGRYLDLSESLHFDALQAFSRQQLVAAADFLLTAAEAGLFAKPEFQQRYPRTLPFCRITLNWFESRPYRLRLARETDLPALLALETACWAEPMRSDESAIRQRLQRFRKGQCLLEMDGDIVAAIYTQRIADQTALAGSTFATLGELHHADGPVFQLLTVNVLPQMQHLGLGDQLLEFMLQYAGLLGGVQRVVGVTRCQNFQSAGDGDMAGYIRRRNQHGQPLDPVLAFHAHHGAAIENLVPNFRPQDLDNQGYGVLISYDLLHRQPGGQIAPAAAAEPNSSGMAALVERCTRDVLGPRRESRFAPATTFKDMGLDSLDLLELRTQLNHAAQVQLEAVFFFRYSSPKLVADYLQAGTAAESSPAPNPEHDRTDMVDESEQVQAEDLADDAIAIIGLGCRFPGGADHAEAYWQLLEQGVDAISEPPPGRGNGELDEANFPASPDMPALRLAGYIDGADRFDAAFFGIAPREAQRMDPQQRLLLEVAWQALEHAGIDPRGLEGTDTGVFVGLFGHDYEMLQQAATPNSELDAYFSTGVSPSVAAGRLSYLLGLQGPALAIDTACSSSLVALHLAGRSLREGECRLALVGGVNLILAPQLSIAFSRAGMLSPDGRCRTFDAEAAGYVRGEGCGVVVVKSLSRALADGDTVYAVLRGSAVNQDGRSNGLTAPNGLAQEAVIRQALAAAGVQAEQVGYVEAHGTGTVLGDPVEVQALQAVYGQGRSPENPLLIGSVKTNIGHLEAAAGIAGLIKLALSLHHGRIPQHLHFRQANPHLDLNAIPTAVPTRTMPWPDKAGQPKLAGLSSFGYSGTNAHVILQSAPASNGAQLPADAGPHLLTLSAPNEAALSQFAADVAQALQSPAADLGAICHTANARRSRQDYRLAAVANNPAALAERLSHAVASQGGDGKVVMLFTGQGSQYPGMGRALYASEPIFRQSLDACDALLRQHSDIRLLELLFATGDDQALHQTGNTQPALFAFEYALASLWATWGIKPAAVLGHSVGEYVAACLAGVFSLEDGLRLIAARGRLMQALPAGGGMASLLAPTAAVASAIEAFGSRAEIAAYNGPNETVVSGPQPAVAELIAHFEAQGLRCIPLQTSHAFHSQLLEPMLEPFRQVCAGIDFAAPNLPYFSNLSGNLADTAVARADYWPEHARRPVRFVQCIAAAEAQGYSTFLEIGPRPILGNLGRQTASNPKARWLASLVPGTDERETLYDALGQLFVAGADIDWPGFYRHKPQRLAALPPYPFQRKRFWFPAKAADAPVSASNTSTASHPLLGCRQPLAGPVRIYQNRLGADAPDYLFHHCLQGRPLFSAAALLEMALAAAESLPNSAGQAWAVNGLSFERSLALPAEQTSCIQFLLLPETSAGSWQFRLLGASETAGAEPDWQLHAQGLLQTVDAATPANADLSALRHSIDTPIAIPAFRADCESRGLQLDAACEAMAELWAKGDQALCRIRLPAASAGYRCHPQLLDAALASALAVLTNAPQVLQSIGRFRWQPHSGNGEVWCHVFGLAKDGNRSTLQLHCYDAGGRWLGGVEDGRFAALTAEPAAARNQWLYRLHWQRAETAESVASALPPPKRLAQALLPLAAELGAAPLAAELAILQGQLERLSLHYVVGALRTLGWDIASGSRDDCDALAERLGIVPAQRRLFRRLLQMLQEEGWLQLDGRRLQVLHNPAAESAADLYGHLSARYPAAADEIGLLGRCGERLADVLNGRCSPLSLLFPDADTASLAGLYRHGPSFLPMQRLLAQALQRISEALPTGETLRLLEIGAGTGGSSSWLLPLLPADRCEYLYTDVSAHFFDAARQRFADYPFVRYRKLDIEQPPCAQGFEAGRYHVLIAGNVLHATADLNNTLKHALSLLAPGGQLLLVEGSAKRRWIDLTFGLLDGWWAFADHDLRPDYPLLDAERWCELLRRQGCREVATVAPAQADGMLFPQNLLLAQADGRPVRQRLLFADKQGIGERLAAESAAAGEAGIIVRAAETFRTLGPAEFGLNPHDPEHYRRLLATVDAEDAEILFLWGLDAGDAEACATAYRSALFLSQALIETGARPGAFWLVTRGAHAVQAKAEPLSVWQAPLWGYGLVLEREHPELGCRLLDLDPSESADAVQDLRQGLQNAGPAQARRSAIRQSQIYLPTMERLPAAQPAFVADPTGTYLISGGLGGMGLQLAAWLVKNGARRLLLVGRRKASAEAEQRMAELAAQGARIDSRQIDISRYADTAALLDGINDLRGIVHCAGQFSDALIQNQQAEQFDTAFAAKALGAWNLHRASQGRPLQLFLLCSSAFSLLPGAGLSTYAAANAFLDGLAAERRRQGLAGLSLNWGPWDKIGMAAAVGERRAGQWAGSGIRTMPADAALAALDAVMAGDTAQAAIMDVDWQRFAAVGTRQPAYLEPLLTRQDRADGPAATIDTPLAERLRQATGQQQVQLLQKHVAAVVSGILGFAGDELDWRRGLFEQGMDSLTAMELRNRLQAELQTPLPATVAMEHPSVLDLAGYLAGRLSNPGLETAAAEHVRTTQVLEIPQDNSGLEALDSAIAAELKGLEDLLKGIEP